MACDTEREWLWPDRFSAPLIRNHYTIEERQSGRASTTVESGMLAINSMVLTMPETPFGGVKDSGYGSEGGTEAMEAYLNTKLISQAGA
jgi:succinate-semialdehyde dehydrogenase / glutarate-semialdehyde dehydrogenase